MMIKYRVSEVAKDFGVPSKDVIELLAKYVDTPKKSATALEENELDLVFEHFTQKNSVENFDAYFATAAEKKEPGPRHTPGSNATLKGSAGSNSIRRRDPVSSDRRAAARFLPGQRLRQACVGVLQVGKVDVHRPFELAEDLHPFVSARVIDDGHPGPPYWGRSRWSHKGAWC